MTTMEAPSRSACPACLSTDVAALIEATESMYGSGEAFAYLQCGPCRSLRLQDPPDDLGQYYPHDYYSVADDPEVVMGKFPARAVIRTLGRSELTGRGLAGAAARHVAPVRQARTLAALFRAVARCGAGLDSRILDVGAGSGALVYALSLAGVQDVVGTDPFAPQDRVFNTGARLLARPLDGLDEGSWDVVMFHHSFEHLLDPEAELRLAVGHLADDGAVLIRMPTVSSWAFDHYGSSWAQLDPPRHLVLFSRSGMQGLAQRCGLEVASVFDDSTAFQFWGSEQVRLGIPLMAAQSHMVHPRSSPFGPRDLATWSRRSQRLNARGRGDQAGWILRRRRPS